MVALRVALAPWFIELIGKQGSTRIPAPRNNGELALNASMPASVSTGKNSRHLQPFAQSPVCQQRSEASTASTQGLQSGKDCGFQLFAATPIERYVRSLASTLDDMYLGVRGARERRV